MAKTLVLLKIFLKKKTIDNSEDYFLLDIDAEVCCGFKYLEYFENMIRLRFTYNLCYAV